MKLSANNETDDKELPTLGRAMSWVDRPGNATILFYGLGVLCGAVFLADFMFERHGKFEFEHFPGFYAIFGFIAFALIVLAAKALRNLIARPQDYYAPYSIDDETDNTKSGEQ